MHDTCRNGDAVVTPLKPGEEEQGDDIDRVDDHMEDDQGHHAAADDVAAEEYHNDFSCCARPGLQHCYGCIFALTTSIIHSGSFF